VGHAVELFLYLLERDARGFMKGSCGTKNGHFMLSTLSFEECKVIKQRLECYQNKNLKY